MAQLLGKLARQGGKAGWRDAGQGWEGVEQELQLQGWKAARRVIVLRRKLKADIEAEADTAQLSFPGATIKQMGGELYEYAVLVTNWPERDLLAVAQTYRDRAGAGNLFDELKNQWGWTGFTTQDLKRPLFQQAIARRTRHANQTRLYISSIHAKAKEAAHLLHRISTP